jgi:hypothetical protein
MGVSLRKVQVALKAPRNASALAIYARAVVEAMTGNRWFPAPVPSLATVMASIESLESAESAALSMTAGLKTVRDEKLRVLSNLLLDLAAYVRSVANEHPDSAPAIVESAGMNVVARTTRPKDPFAIRPGRVSGEVLLIAKAIAKVASYDWEMSKSGRKTWTRLPPSLQSRTKVSGLVVGTTYLFRMRATTRTGEGDWCEPVEFLAR